MRMTLADIAKIIGGKVVGNADILITGLSGIKEARSGDLTFLANPKYAGLAKDTQASAIVVGEGVLVDGKAVVQTANPSLAFSKAISLWKGDGAAAIKGIHPTAVIAPDAALEAGVAVGPHAVIEPGVKIGKASVISAGVYVGTNVSIGENCFIYPNVTIREDGVIGNRVIIHSSTVVGSDGFGYLQVDGKHLKVPQVGNVVIEDDVEIGACVAIDRARFDKTLIGKGTKIDNLVQIAHNVRVGENCLIIALAGIAGSAEIGKNAIIAGQVGVAGHVKVGEGAVAAAQTGITKDVPAGEKLFGTPALEYKKATRQLLHLGRLPGYAEELKALREKVAALEKKLEDKA